MELATSGVIAVSYQFNMAYLFKYLAMFVVYYYCLSPPGKSGDPVKIDSVTITPDPPVKGKNVSIKATFTLSMCMCRLF